MSLNLACVQKKLNEQAWTFNTQLGLINLQPFQPIGMRGGMAPILCPKRPVFWFNIGSYNQYVLDFSDARFWWKMKNTM